MEMRNKVKKSRNPNFDILRSLAMLSVVMVHYIKAIGSGLCFDLTTSAGTFNYIASMILFIMFMTAVPCFVMISGYFMINKTEFKIRRFESTWLKSFFVVALIYIYIYVFHGHNAQLLKDVASIPIMGFKHSVSLWFVDYYLGLVLVSPFLAMCVQQLTKRQYQLLLVVLLFLSFTIFGKFGTAFGDVNKGYSLQYFVFMFLLGGYIRLYNPFADERKDIIYFSIFIFLQLLVQLIHALSHGFGSYNQVNIVYSGLEIFISFFVFLWFKNHKFTSKLWKPLIVVAPYTFAVYLFHDNRFIRDFLWHQDFQPSLLTNSWSLIPMMFVVCIMVFIFGCLIDYLRSLLVRLIHGDELLDKINKSLYNAFLSRYESLKKK